MVVRGVVRYGVVLLCGVIAGSRLVGAVQAWRAWRQWAAIDPSGADAYRTFARVSSAAALLSLAVAGLVWWLLRPGAGKVRDGAAATRA